MCIRDSICTLHKINESSIQAVYTRPRDIKSVTYQTTSSTCSHRSTTCHHACRWAPTAAATSFFHTSFFHRRSGDLAAVRSLSLHLVRGIGYRQNWNSCVRQQQHSSVTYRLSYSTQHYTSLIDYGMCHRANCRRRTIQMLWHTSLTKEQRCPIEYLQKRAIKICWQ